MASYNRDTTLLRILREELEPYPGRMAGCLRDTLAISVALIAAMTLRIPGIDLALPLLFLMQRERPGLTFRVGLEMFGASVAAGVTSLAWVQVTDATDVGRFFGIVLGIAIASFCMATTTRPLFFSIFAFYGFLDLASWDAHRSSGDIVTSILYNIASVGTIILCSVAVEFFFATKEPEQQLTEEMQKRIVLLSRFFRAMSRQQATPAFRSLHHSVVQQAHSGTLHMNELYDRIRSQHSGSTPVPLGLHYRIGLLARILEKSALIGFDRDISPVDHASYASIAELCDQLQIRRNGIAPSAPLPPSASGRLRAIHEELRQYSGGVALRTQERAIRTKTGIKSRQAFVLFLPDAVRSRASILYALKLTLAATLCYIIYSAVDWPGISTCVITVMLTGLSSTGAMKQKQLFRFSGAVIGGVIGLLVVSLLFPNMDSITSLVIVVAIVSMLAGWTMRSPRMSYVGVQIGFAFYLTTLSGFGPSTEIAPARDRVVGVVVGILVMWLVFDQLWPNRTSAALGLSLHRIRGAASELRNTVSVDALHADQMLARLRVSVSMELANVQQLDSAVYFDFGPERKRELVRCRNIIRKIEAAAADFYTTAGDLIGKETALTAEAP